MAVNEKDVFISYSSNDRAFATRLYNELYAQGVAVWMDVADIPPGHRWDRVIQEALETSTHLLLVHTQASFESDNVWDEWSFFLQRNKPVIPLIVENVKLPFRLERVHHVDFCTQAFDHAIRQLVQVLPHFEPIEPPPTPGIVSHWPHLAQRRERLSLEEDRDERDGPPQRRRKLQQQEELYRQYSIEDDYPAQPLVDNPLRFVPAQEQLIPVHIPRNSRSIPRDDTSPFDSHSDRPPRSSVRAPWIEEAESLVDSRFSYTMTPLNELNRQTIQDSKPSQAHQAHGCPVNADHRPLG